ncbi:microcystin-dependent protein [Bacillus oleivorans]|uniref:Microcystin-dependent protein n=1 Tax=Bacillus oleivorans TaxID=1448271 RepID=A0A285CJ35_9BACI|nr:tail fiber protein [Bacillus oleivorans]SNX67016.1 microcystin-dependent protein [Bacillus oleivorans]
MSEPFIGEIRAFAIPYAPRGWATCDGQTLAIAANPALYSILGTTYGGNGTTTFCLPNLNGRVPVHSGNGIHLGEASGEEGHALSIQEMPMHTHQARGSEAAASEFSISGNTWAKSTTMPFGNSFTAQMSSEAIAITGENTPHSNMQPYLVVNYCIALTGIFPPRD